MNFPGHAIGAGASSTVIIGLLLFFKDMPLVPALAAGGVFWLGGQFPDLDIGSKFGRWVGCLGFPIAAFLFSAGILFSDFLFMGISSGIGLFALMLMGSRVLSFSLGSIPGRWFGRLGFVISSILLGLGIWKSIFVFMIISGGLGLIALLVLIMKHRGPTHKYWLPLLLIAVAIFGVFPHNMISPLMFMFALGIILHLCQDGIFPWSFKGWFL
jgi:hypothetical protein